MPVGSQHQLDEMKSVKMSCHSVGCGCGNSQFNLVTSMTSDDWLDGLVNAHVVCYKAGCMSCM